MRVKSLRLPNAIRDNYTQSIESLVKFNSYKNPNNSDFKFSGVDNQNTLHLQLAKDMLQFVLQSNSDDLETKQFTKDLSNFNPNILVTTVANIPITNITLTAPRTTDAQWNKSALNIFAQLGIAGVLFRDLVDTWHLPKTAPIFVTPLFDVISSDHHRGSKAPLLMHVDEIDYAVLYGAKVDIDSLLCLSNNQVPTIFISAEDLFNSLEPSIQKILLEKNYRITMFGQTSKPFSIFTKDNGKIEIFHDQDIRNLLFVSKEAKEAVAVLNNTLEAKIASGDYLSVCLNKGEALYAENHSVIHGRKDAIHEFRHLQRMQLVRGSSDGAPSLTK